MCVQIIKFCVCSSPYNHACTCMCSCIIMIMRACFYTCVIVSLSIILVSISEVVRMCNIYIDTVLM